MSKIRVVARYEKMGEPYIRVRLSDGRVIREHRFLMEQAIGRRLEPWEHVHHKDENKRNNVLENLEIKTASVHSRDHRPVAEKETLTCPICGQEFARTKRYLRSKRKQGHSTFYCGNSCSRTGRSQVGDSALPVRCVCPVCDKAFDVPSNQYRLRMRRSKAGRLGCSRTCGQKLGAMVK